MTLNIAFFINSYIIIFNFFIYFNTIYIINLDFAESTIRRSKSYIILVLY
ncbi:hypothetical protein WAI453_006627 [Rhynchosporium graminicola]